MRIDSKNANSELYKEQEKMALDNNTLKGKVLSIIAGIPDSDYFPKKAERSN